MKTQTIIRVSSPAPKKPARKDSAVRVSLSSYHNVKEPFESAANSHGPEPPMEANPPSGVNDSRSAPETSPVLLGFCPMDRAVAYNPAGSHNNPREVFI